MQIVIDLVSKVSGLLASTYFLIKTIFPPPFFSISSKRGKLVVLYDNWASGKVSSSSDVKSWFLRNLCLGTQL